MGASVALSLKRTTRYITRTCRLLAHHTNTFSYYDQFTDIWNNSQPLVSLIELSMYPVKVVKVFSVLIRNCAENSFGAAQTLGPV